MILFLLPLAYKGRADDLCLLRASALALALSDEIRGAAERQAIHGGGTPAALFLVGHEPGLSIDALARMLGMSHPGAVPLVQRLEQDRLIARKPTSDGRTVALHLTVAGRKRWVRLFAERRTALEESPKRLSARERAHFVRRPSAIPARWLTGKLAQQGVSSSLIGPVLPISRNQKVVNNQMRYLAAQALSGAQVKAKMDAGETAAQGGFLGSRRKSFK